MKINGTLEFEARNKMINIVVFLRVIEISETLWGQIEAVGAPDPGWGRGLSMYGLDSRWLFEHTTARVAFCN